MQDDRYSGMPAPRLPSPRTPQTQQSWPPGISPYAPQPGWTGGQPLPPRRAPSEPRMSKAEALTRVASLKTGIAWLSVVAFGAFAWLAAAHLSSSGAAQSSSGGQTTQPGVSGDDGQQQRQDDNGGFFNQGGAGFGSGNVQQPSSSSGVS